MRGPDLKPRKPRVEFWSQVHKGPDCWTWHGFLDSNGYARIGGKSAHRLAYVNARGQIPAGLEIDHLCRNRACVNPDHMEPVTHLENMRRSHAAVATTCKRGHPRNERNVYLSSAGRRCRVCTAMSQARYQARKSR